MERENAEQFSWKLKHNLKYERGLNKETSGEWMELKKQSDEMICDKIEVENVRRILKTCMEIK